jgi:hypothetical protein
MTINPPASPSVIEEIIERRATHIASRPRRSHREPFGPDDFKAHSVPYDRRIRKDWSEPGMHGLNLKRELADIRSRPELLDEKDFGFIQFVESHGVRGDAEAWLSRVHETRLRSIVSRCVDPVARAVWFKRRHASQCEAGRLAAERTAAGQPTVDASVDDQGDFKLQTFVYRR